MNRVWRWEEGGCCPFEEEKTAHFLFISVEISFLIVGTASRRFLYAASMLREFLNEHTAVQKSEKIYNFAAPFCDFVYCQIEN